MNTLSVKDIKTACARIYSDAADYLEKYGWVQRADRDGSRRCMGMAVIESANKEYGTVGYLSRCSCTGVGYMADVAMTLLARFMGVPSIPGWNDEPGREVSEVIRTLRKAAEEVVS
jgi:hypothetical protein